MTVGRQAESTDQVAAAGTGVRTVVRIVVQIAEGVEQAEHVEAVRGAHHMHRRIVEAVLEVRRHTHRRIVEVVLGDRLVEGSLGVDSLQQVSN
jgi:hypothetical protein